MGKFFVWNVYGFGVLKMGTKSICPHLIPNSHLNLKQNLLLGFTFVSFVNFTHWHCRGKLGLICVHAFGIVVIF